MKKIFCSTLILIALVFTSCSRCKTCTSASTIIPLDVELCRDDFDSGKEYSAPSMITIDDGNRDKHFLKLGIFTY